MLWVTGIYNEGRFSGGILLLWSDNNWSTIGNNAPDVGENSLIKEDANVALHLLGVKQFEKEKVHVHQGKVN